MKVSVSILLLVFFYGLVFGYCFGANFGWPEGW